MTSGGLPSAAVTCATRARPRGVAALSGASVTSGSLPSAAVTCATLARPRGVAALSEAFVTSGGLPSAAVTCATRARPRGVVHLGVCLLRALDRFCIFYNLKYNTNHILLYKWTEHGKLPSITTDPNTVQN